jgi:hypothetical protein
MVVLIGFLLFVAVLLTRLTYKVNYQAHKIQRINVEKEALIIELALLKAQIDGKETERTKTKKASTVYAD